MDQHPQVFPSSLLNSNLAPAAAAERIVAAYLTLADDSQKAICRRAGVPNASPFEFEEEWEEADGEEDQEEEDSGSEAVGGGGSRTDATLLKRVAAVEKVVKGIVDSSRGDRELLRTEIQQLRSEVMPVRLEEAIKEQVLVQRLKLLLPTGRYYYLNARYGSS